MIGNYEEYPEMLNRLFLEDKTKGFEAKTDGLYARTITFQVTEDCCMKCSYCYQHNKKPNRMSFEVAKQFIDDLLSGSEKVTCYIPKDSVGIVLEFIGGEPFLEIDLVSKITDYYFEECARLHHPWATRTRISISTNGLLNFDPRVQSYLKKHQSHLSLNITVDGNKQLHDSCRVDLENKGTYDRVIAAVNDYTEKYGKGALPTKMTIAPNNVGSLSEAVIEMIEYGYPIVNFNPVYEDVWSRDDARTFYKQLKQLADYLIEHDKLDPLVCPYMSPVYCHPMLPEDNHNWCGGTGAMIAIDWQGNIYPCIRYMPNALGDDVIPYIIGTVKDGIMSTEQQFERVNCLSCITRRSQSTDECFNCPIASGCGWCSGYCYEKYGTADKRTTFICDLHKARALALTYMWNKYYRKIHSKDTYPMDIPDEWALQIIDKDELRMIKSLIKE